MGTQSAARSQAADADDCLLTDCCCSSCGLLSLALTITPSAATDCRWRPCYAMWTLPSGVRTKFAFFEKFMPKIEPVLRQLFRAKYFQA
jgi:hypothetical protein